MRILSLFTLLVLIGHTAQAQSVTLNLRGKVTSGGAPVAGAVVTLLGKGKAATTDVQGAYVINDASVALAPSVRSGIGHFEFRQGVLELTVPASATAKVEVFGILGNFLKRETIENAEAGVYRVDVSGLSPSAQMVFVKATIGNESRTWRFDPFRKGIAMAGSREDEAASRGVGGFAKVAAIVDSLRVVKQGLPTKVVTIESFDAVVDITLGVPTGDVFVEDAGLDCAVGSATGANGGSSTVLPDPFTKWDGSQVKTMADWRCRRREIVVEVENRILGTKAPPPSTIGGTVTGTVSNTAYTVNVTNPDGSTSFSGTITLPSTGQAPYPAVIVVGGFNSLNKDVMSSEGVATISYNNNAIASEAANDFTTGKYYDANPDMKGNTSALVAWAWGVSRMIDVFEQNPTVIDPSKIGVHGCSRLGKAAFVIGAFDQRIALGLPLEPGTGGPAPLRALPSMGGQTLASANGEASWFGPMSKNYASSMAVDMDAVAAMYAPRGLLMMDNPHIDHLSYKANYLGIAAAREVYKAMGKEDAAWYLGSSNNGGHCSERAEYGDELRAMFKKFFKGDASAATGGLDKHSSHGNINVESWTSSWKKGTITP